jgi:hypothetical protein
MAFPQVRFGAAVGFYTPRLNIGAVDNALLQDDGVSFILLDDGGFLLV